MNPNLQPYEIAFITIDMTNDFMLIGAPLAVPGALDIIDTVNRGTEYAEEKGYLQVFTRDWHPLDSKHFEKWPVHDVQDTPGAEFHDQLVIPKSVSILLKGLGHGDAYSPFDEEADIEGMLLEPFSRKRGIKAFVVRGLATDWCVKAFVLDALQKGFIVYVLEDAIKAVNLSPEDGANAIAKMRAAGAVFTNTEEVTNGKIF